MKSKLLFLFVIFLFAACDQIMENENAAEQDKLPEAVEAQQAQVKDFSEIGFELLETEIIGDLKIGLTTAEVEKITGKPDEITPFEEWAVDGFEHQTRVYQKETIELDFIKLEDGRIVSNTITISEGCHYKTSRNIGIGSTYDHVLQAYKNEISTPESLTTLIAGSIYGGIIFQFSDKKKVNHIFIGESIE